MAINFSINSIQPQAILPEATRPAARVFGGDSSNFRSVFEDAVAGVESLRADAHQQIGQFLAGESEDPHKMILSVQNADLAFQMFVQVRNKFTSAYQEVMRMQL